MSNILVVLESREGSLRAASLEALGAARTFADQRGSSVIALATEKCELDASLLGGAGADKVLIADAAGHSADGAAATAARVAKESDATVVLLSATVRGRDLTARIAALLGTGFAADCTAADAEAMTFTRPEFGGKAFTTIKINGPVAVASLRGNFFAAAGREASAEMSEVASEAGVSMVTEISSQTGGRPDVSEATKVVAGGRGMGEAENWSMIEAVADAIPGCALGASRAVVDSGWRPHSEQVGQTGKTVAPELYIAAGISGAIQHLAGMNSSKVIVAINKDAEAPIFKHATYGIVGDALEVLPALADELKKLGL
ncbi:MAG: electron transfer flavoprotein subunit alpha/FixB family protein [Planctomycetes bacterium]|nr:electron transfer flavoprotein subunit alpha/FixB family protein [Planctomycetota bacterium]MCP4770076.1 electron transfer flavoprotein subunit alpha/FixB family protein [Planctomycetota bacterium]MCP4860776.1 electron transfer flavoprotein subunit alpha/FixB family protein [Planctomycetota bacterium]